MNVYFLLALETQAWAGWALGVQALSGLRVLVVLGVLGSRRIAPSLLPTSIACPFSGCKLLSPVTDGARVLTLPVWVSSAASLTMGSEAILAHSQPQDPVSK